MSKKQQCLKIQITRERGEWVGGYVSIKKVHSQHKVYRVFFCGCSLGSTVCTHIESLVVLTPSFMKNLEKYKATQKNQHQLVGTLIINLFINWANMHTLYISQSGSFAHLSIDTSHEACVAVSPPICPTLELLWT